MRSCSILLGQIQNNGLLMQLKACRMYHLESRNKSPVAVKHNRDSGNFPEIFAIHPNLGGGGLKGIFGELWSDSRWTLTAVVVTSCSERPRTKRHCQAFIHTWQRRYRVKKIDCYVVMCKVLLPNRRPTKKNQNKVKNEKGAAFWKVSAGFFLQSAFFRFLPPVLYISTGT